MHASFAQWSLWLALVAGTIGMVRDVPRRRWLRVTAWACGMTAYAVRQAGLPEAVSDPLSLAFMSVFLALVLADIVRRPKPTAD